MIMNLSGQQQQAVEYLDSPTLVVAGAGSGKTRTLTAKIAHLITCNIPSDRILAITFTNKAAEEMKSRLVEQTGIPLFRFPWVRTFHSACYKIFKEHCGLMGYQQPLQIYATYQQQKLIKDIAVGEMNIEKSYVPVIAAEISNAKNSGSPETYFTHKPRVARKRMIDIYHRYEQELKSKNAVDFDNILFLTRNLLRDHTSIRAYYQNLFDFILCDEYQDTNNIQEELTGLLMKDGKLFCVGDDWQAIYSFRGSNVDHFLDFQNKYTGARIFRLEQNYRSADEIVQVANNLIGYNDHKLEKKCFSEKHGGLVELYDFENDNEEADWVTRKILSLKGMDIPLDKMAVLYRTKFCSLSFEKAFRQAGIPYRMLGGKGFFERREILDLNCYLTAAAFVKDDAAFERILNTPKRGMGPGAVKKLAALKTPDISLQEAARISLSTKVLAPKVYQALKSLLELLDDIREMNPAQAVQTVLDRVNYIVYLKESVKTDTMDFTSRQENIEQLIFSASQKTSIVEYLEEAALIREDRKDDEEEQSRGVSLSTIHAAKGLEFHVVFVVGCEEQLFPHWRSTETTAGLYEERRLMYVAVTRSEKYLYLTSAGYRKGQFNRKSRFLDEIESSLKG
jgi:DNA helicase-2/ATP-dependent DNA helicase PcrA